MSTDTTVHTPLSVPPGAPSIGSSERLQVGFQAISQLKRGVAQRAKDSDQMHRSRGAVKPFILHYHPTLFKHFSEWVEDFIDGYKTIQ